MLSLQAQLAYSAARSDVECYCQAAGMWRERWFIPQEILSVGSSLGEDTETVATAIRYLDLRGLIERHPTQPWVRVRDEQC